MFPHGSVASLLKYCTTILEVTGSILNVSIQIFKYFFRVHFTLLLHIFESIFDDFFAPKLKIIKIDP